MKKMYIIFFALIVGLVPAYNYACDCTCLFNREEVIVIDSTQAEPDAAPAAAPIAQVMEAKTRKRAPHLRLNALQLQRITKPSQEAPVELDTIDENEEEVSAVIPVAFQARNPMPKKAQAKQEDPNHELLNALKNQDQETAHALLEQEQLSYEILDAYNRARYTPLLYAIQYNYWDIVTLLLQQGATPPLVAQVKQVTTDETYPIYTRTLREAFNTRKPLPKSLTSLQILQGA